MIDLLRSALVILFCMVIFSCDAQITPQAKFGYNSCDLVEEIAGNYSPGIIFGSPDCVCGVESQAMDFDGIDDCAILDESLKQLLVNDFTMSFYFFKNQHTMSAPLFSIKDTCSNRDSSLTIRYLPLDNELEIQFSENIADRITFIHPLDDNFCWQHVVITKLGNDYSFYLNGEFIESDNITRPILLGTNHLVQLGNSSCVGFSDQKFDGIIDELCFYDQVLLPEQIEQLNQKPDKIISNDTTIFEGNSVVIEFEGSCGNVTWSPTTDLSNDIINPVSTPAVTTSYMVNINHGNCISADTITINVVSEDDIKCDDLLMPDAFTPNGDGVNDEYEISNDFIIDELTEFSIYDRWGGKLFESQEKEQGWDGFTSGQEINSGVFVYRVEYVCKGDEYQKVGNFSLMR